MMVVGFCFFFFIHLESSGVREVGGASFLTTKQERPIAKSQSFGFFSLNIGLQITRIPRVDMC
jgi:hypothetical protein